MWLTLLGTLVRPIDAAHLHSYAVKGKRMDGVRFGMMVAHLRAGYVALTCRNQLVLILGLTWRVETWCEKEPGDGGRRARSEQPVWGRELSGFMQIHPVKVGIDSRIPGPATGIETSHVRGRMNGKFTQRIEWIINLVSR